MEYWYFLKFWQINFYYYLSEIFALIYNLFLKIFKICSIIFTWSWCIGYLTEVRRRAHMMRSPSMIRKKSKYQPLLVQYSSFAADIISSPTISPTSSPTKSHPRLPSPTSSPTISPTRADQFWGNFYFLWLFQYFISPECLLHLTYLNHFYSYFFLFIIGGLTKHAVNAALLEEVTTCRRSTCQPANQSWRRSRPAY